MFPRLARRKARQSEKASPSCAEEDEAVEVVDGGLNGRRGLGVDVDAEVVIRHLKNLGMVNLFPLKVMSTYAMKDMDS